MKSTTLRIGILSGLMLLAAPVAARAAEKLNGYAEFRQGKYLIVDGQRVRVSSRTKFEGSGNANDFDSIPLGYEVKVKGHRDKKGYILAKRVTARRNRSTSTDEELKEGFDKIEKHYLDEGRMTITDEKGTVVEDHGELLTEGPRVDRVRGIMVDLVPSYIDPADLRVYVVDNEEWNAMAAPNFSIYVFTGLLDDMDDDEVAIVLGHELAHASYEHSRKQYQKSTWIQIGALAAALAGGSAIEDDTTRTAAQLGTILAASAVVNGYSRDHEDQADRVGMRYAYEAGYDVTKGPKLWKRFSDKYGDSGKVVNFFFGGHSRSSKRAVLLEREIAFNGYGEPRATRTAGD